MSRFWINQQDIKRLKKFYKRAPRQFMYAAKGVLTTLAFKARDAQITEIQTSMTIRNTRFVQSKIRYQKARGNRIDNLHSLSGSVRSNRFSGWEEQELGTTTTRTRTQSLSARGDDWKNQVRGSVRMKTSNRFLDVESEGEGSTLEQKTASVLAGMRKGTIAKRNFLIRRRMGGRMRTMRTGLYGMKRRLIYRYQTFKPDRVQPKRNRWHTMAISKMMGRISLRNEWANQIKRILKYK